MGALRSTSHVVCLPRESQQIDRIIEAFAESYHIANPRTFPDHDAVYLTAFAIVMLNADAHTANVKKKMTRAEFVRNCTLATPAVETYVLEGIYDRVTSREITLSAASNTNTDINGLLCRAGSDVVSNLLGNM